MDTQHLYKEIKYLKDGVYNESPQNWENHKSHSAMPGQKEGYKQTTLSGAEQTDCCCLCSPSLIIVLKKKLFCALSRPKSTTTSKVAQLCCPLFQRPLFWRYFSHSFSHSRLFIHSIQDFLFILFITLQHSVKSTL